MVDSEEIPHGLHRDAEHLLGVRAVILIALRHLGILHGRDDLLLEDRDSFLQRILALSRIFRTGNSCCPVL